MQSYAREYLGKNQFWTPSSIGFTNSLIDNKLNNLDEIDTSGLLSKNEANETYLKKTDSNSLLSKNEAENTYLKKTDYSPPNITYSHSYLYTLTSYHNKYIYINNIKSRGEGSVITINLPSSVTGAIRYVSLNFNVWTAAIGGCASELDQLCCKLAIKSEDVYKDIDSRDGPALRGSKIASCCYRFNFSQFFTNIIDNKLYLRFFFIETGAIEKTDEDMNNGIYITYNDAYPEFELTVVGFNI